MTEKQLLKKAIQVKGVESQLQKAAEELNELAAQINKYLYYRSIEKTFKLAVLSLTRKHNAISGMIEELVDVNIMCKQLHMILPMLKDSFVVDYSDYWREKTKRLSESVKIASHNKIQV